MIKQIVLADPLTMTPPPTLRVTGRGLCIHLRDGFEQHDFSKSSPTFRAECFVCKKKFWFNIELKRFVEVAKA